MRMIAGTTWRVDEARKYIEDRVQKVPWSGCWLWEKSLDGHGYGHSMCPVRYCINVVARRRRRGAVRQAHRLAFEAFVSEIPGGLCVCHACDVPACCNPDHLWLGTVADNNRDRDAKGRQATGSRNGRHTKPEAVARGSRHGSARICEEDVIEMRVLRDKGAKIKELAARYDISDSQVERIIKRQSWAHIAEQRGDALP